MQSELISVRLNIGKVESGLMVFYLGTTYSLVAVYRDGRSEIIQNDQGNRLMPSCVGFNEIERFVGDEAKLHIDSNSENTIYGGI